MTDDEMVKTIHKKEKEIKEILTDGTITYGMAKRIISHLEVELLRDGDTYLKEVNYRDVSQKGNYSPSLM